MTVASVREGLLQEPLFNYVVFQVHRVLKSNGIFFCITFRQAFFMYRLLRDTKLWDIDMQIISGKGSFDYYAYILRKAT